MNEIIEVLKHLPYGDFGFAGLVVLAIVLIFQGKIVPQSTLEAMRSDRDIIITAKTEEAETWKEAYQLSEEARSTSAEADRELLELGRTTVHLLKSIHERAQGVQS